MTTRDATRREVAILGAGFSCAISADLPLANELGELACDRARAQNPELFRSCPTFTDLYPFETWLSLLVEEQPHLDDGGNKLNAARFAKLAQTIVDIIEERQARALSTKAPSWLYSLVSAFHQRQTTVVTFNYDTLLEVAINSTFLAPRDFGIVSTQAREDLDLDLARYEEQRISPEDVIGGGPPLAQLPRPPEATMRLLKLHGSLGWWWVPNDESGATIVREEITNTFGHDPKAWTARKAHWTLGGREPFIVPPLAAKSPYYRNPLTRHLWRTAFEAIREADRIVFIGYSLPRTDLVVGGMVESAIRGREVDVLIVDPCPDGIAERLACLGGPAEESGRLTRFPGDNAVEEFARWLCEDTAKDVPPRAARLADELVPERRDPAIVVWSVGGEPRRHRVVAAENCSDGTLRLSTELEVFHGAEPSEQVPTTLDILGLARGARRIVARTAEGQESVIVACTVYGLGNPSARQMLYLVPAA